MAEIPFRRSITECVCNKDTQAIELIQNDFKDSLKTFNHRKDVSDKDSVEYELSVFALGKIEDAISYLNRMLGKQEQEPDVIETTSLKKEEQQVSNTTSVDEIKKNIVDWNKGVFTSDEVCSLLGISKGTLSKWRDNGYISFSRPEGSDKVWFTRQNIEDFLSKPEVLHKAWKK